MINKTLATSLGIIAVCALSFSLPATPKTMTKQVTIIGHVEGTVQVTAMGAMNVECIDIGVTSHAGRYHNIFTGTLQANGAGTSAGTWTAANGDQLVWTAVVSGTAMTVTVQSGTGKYLGAVGGFTGEMSNLAILVDPETGAGTISYDYKGKGSLTY